MPPHREPYLDQSAVGLNEVDISRTLWTWARCRQETPHFSGFFGQTDLLCFQDLPRYDPATGRQHGNTLERHRSRDMTVKYAVKSDIQRIVRLRYEVLTSWTATRSSRMAPRRSTCRTSLPTNYAVVQRQERWRRYQYQISAFTGRGKIYWYLLQ